MPVQGMRSGRAFAADDWVADEVPVAFEYNGIAHAVMLASPIDLEDFALGFSLSEGIVDTASQLYGCEETSSPSGITLRLEIAAAAFARLKQRRRSLAGRTGCGLCGTESLQQVERDLAPLPTSAPLRREAVAAAMSQVSSLQRLREVTGAVHAAAWVSADGDVQVLREDVGRHNALDKVIGALTRTGLDPGCGFMAITSRASFEMVQKTAAVGVPVLAAVSAPTSLAVTTAERLHLTLVGFARRQDFVAYSHPGRLIGLQATSGVAASTRPAAPPKNVDMALHDLLPY